MISSLLRAEDGTLTLTITIPWEKVKKTQEEVVNAAVETAEVSGFRKGKAPKKVVEERLDKEKMREEVLKKLLPDSYIQAVQEQTIRPVINPKIHVEKLEDGKDWQFMAITSEAPVVDLGDYKNKVKSVTAKGKIVLPGKEPEQPKFEDIAQVLLETAKVTLPKILIEQEADRLLAQTLDEIKRLGLSLDQYLSSTGRDPQSLRADYEKRAENDLKLEFVLQKITEEEKITVDEKEINEAILKAKDDEERKNLEANKYLLASILRQQKTFDFLRNL